MSSASRHSGEDRLVEADPADVEEQQLAASPGDEEVPPGPVRVLPEVPEADAAEQSVEVVADEEDEPR